VGLSLIAAACGSDDKTTSTTASPTTAAVGAATTAASTATTAGSATTTAATTGGSASATTTRGSTATGASTPATAAGAVLTVELNPDAVWDDGSPITVADVECTWQANLKTPGSITTAGYDQITSVKAGKSDKEAVITFGESYAAYKTLFNVLLKKAAHDNCEDVSNDFTDTIPYSGRAWKMESWSPEQSIFVPNDKYWGTDKATYKQLIQVPKPDTEIQALKAGEVDFIYPQFYAGIEDELADPNVKVKLDYGGDFEAIYFNAKEGRPFSDPALREGLYKSVDLEALYKQIYDPIAPGRDLLTCGPIIPGDYCPSGIFGNKLDLAGAAAVLTKAGYAKNGEGLWAKGGKVPDIKWMINAGNSRRESTQAYLIPLLKAAGFNVTADNCDAACVFQQRQPSGDYDMAMYISTAPPDPSYLTPTWAGDQIPTDANGNVGQNFQWWSNDIATKALHAADRELDPAKRAADVQTALKEMDKDYILIPLFQFPKSGAYRTDKVGNVEGNLNNYRAFSDTQVWQDKDGDGKVVIGGEQWPECLNPITNCANSSWYVWTVSFPLLPGVWDTTNDQKFAITNLVTGEPTVKAV
jgi:peptide/nickel transport system substrate-binding protein